MPSRLKAVAVAPDPRARALLPGSQFSDAYRVESEVAPRGARAICQAMAGSPAKWVDALMWLRNLLVRPLRLKTGDADLPPTPLGRVGMFPVLDESPDSALLGLDDRHLDFRVLVAVAGAQVTVTTAVRTHNALGRAYLAVVKPFHRFIVPRMLARAARNGWRVPSAPR